jgi:hypothetical protein
MGTGRVLATFVVGLQSYRVQAHHCMNSNKRRQLKLKFIFGLLFEKKIWGKE